MFFIFKFPQKRFLRIRKLWVIRGVFFAQEPEPTGYVLRRVSVSGGDYDIEYSTFH